MGFFSSIADAAKNANEDAHGDRLLKGVQSTFSTMENVSDEVQRTTMLGFIQIQDRLIQQMPNWSRDGRLELGRNMQNQARTVFDTDMAGGYAKWLAGAWLESKERNSIKAQQAFSSIERFSKHFRKAVEIEVATNKNSQTATFISSLLDFHLKAVGGTLLSFSKLNDQYVLGYVLGIHCGVMQCMNIPSNSEHRLEIWLLSFTNLTDTKEQAIVILQQCIDMENESEKSPWSCVQFITGFGLGKTEAIEFCEEKIIPTGLEEYLPSF